MLADFIVGVFTVAEITADIEPTTIVGVFEYVSYCRLLHVCIV